MKCSIYNTYIPSGKNEYILFNTLTGSFLLIDGELKNCLEGGEKGLMGLNNVILRGLDEQGMVVEKRVDERRIFEYNYNVRIYSTMVSSFIIYPTYACNLSCNYCYEKDLALPEKTMDEAVVKRAIRFIKNMTIENNSRKIVVGFFGGEPLLEYETCVRISKEIFDWSKKHKIGYYGTLTTNGTLFSDDVAKYIGRYISSVQITLDGCRDVHDSKRQYSDGRGTYDDIMAAVSRFKGSRTHVALRVHMDDDISNIEQLLADLGQRGFNRYPNFHINFALVAPPNACLHYDDDGLFSNGAKKALELFPKLWSLAARNGFKRNSGSIAGAEDQIHELCSYIKKGVYMIDPSGDLYLCPVFTGDKKYSIGSLTTSGDARWSQFYSDLMTRNPAVIPGCRDCVFLPQCEGGCPISSHMKRKKLNTRSCSPGKFSIEEKVRSYLGHHYPEKFGEINHENF